MLEIAIIMAPANRNPYFEGLKELWREWILFLCLDSASGVCDLIAVLLLFCFEKGKESELSGEL